jgi:hypothetical protein
MILWQGGFRISKKYIGSISDVFWAREFEFEQIEVTRLTVAEIWEREKVWEQLPSIGRTAPYKASHVRVSSRFVADKKLKTMQNRPIHRKELREKIFPRERKCVNISQTVEQMDSIHSDMNSLTQDTSEINPIYFFEILNPPCPMVAILMKCGLQK